MNELHTVILQILPLSGSEERGAVWTRAMRAFRTPIEKEEFEAALHELQRAREIEFDNKNVRRTAPDFPERQLEGPVQQWLFGDDLFAQLKLDRARTVSQKTAVGGRMGAGLWSRPDFTVATVRRRKYDPLRHLDVIAFELKNLAGAHVVAVHEALAHTRFAHYAYLVCPRHHLHADRHAGIKKSCAEHGIGLLTFELAAGPNEQPLIKEPLVELAADRRSPDPDVVDQYIDDRLSQQNTDRLRMIAGDDA